MQIGLIFLEGSKEFEPVSNTRSNEQTFRQRFKNLH